MKLRKTFRTFRPALRLRVVLLLATGTAAGSTAAIDTVLAAAPACVGDYDGDGNVTMDEIIVTVNAVLDGGDTNVNVGDVVTAVNNARSRCPQPLTPTPTATPSTTGPCVPTPSNMVAWWPLDEPTGSGVVSDIGLPIANDGTSQPGAIGAGGPNAVAGNLVTNPPDSALFFYSPTTYVEVPPSADLNLNDLTVDGWVGLLPGPWTAGTTSLHVYPLVDKLNLASNTGYAFYVEVETTCSGCNPPPPGGASSTTNMRLVLALGNGALNIYRSVPFYSGSGTVFPFPTPPTQLAPTQPPSWLHAAVVLDHGQSVIKFYYTGAVLALYPNPVVALNNNDPLWVGGTRLYGTSHAPAFTEFKLNEIEVFNVPLPQSDLQSIAHSSGGKCKPGGFIGPRMGGGTCPNPNDVCRPRPDDSGCFCNSEEPFPTPTPTSLRSATPTRTTTRTPTSTRTSGDILRTATPTRTPTSMTATPTGTQCVPTPSSMIAWWKLNELTGSVSVVDIGGSPAHNGTSQQGPIGANGPVSVPGNLGTNPPDTALLFSTPATYVEVPATSDLELVNSDLTIDAWIESIEVHPVLPGTIHVVEPIVDKLGSGNTGYALYLEITATCLACPASGLAPPGTQQTVDMRLVFAIGDGANMFFYPSISIYPGGSGGVYGVTPHIPIAPPWPAGWMHLTVSIDRSAGNVGTFYLDGNTKGSFTPVTGQNSGSTVPFWIGGTRLVPTTVPFHGEIVINELEIFDAALSQADIQSIVNAPDGKCTPVPTITATPATATPTRTPSRSPSATVSRTATDTRTATRSPSPTPSTTSTATITSTRAPTATPTVTRSASPTPTATPGTATNLLANPGFELDVNSDGLPDGWSTWARFTRSSAVVHGGAFAGRFRAANDSGATITQRVSNLTAGTTYNFAGWVNIPPTTDAFNLKLQVRWLNSANNTISTKTMKTYSAATAGWDQTAAALVAPAGTVKADIRLVVSSLSATIYVDDFSFATATGQSALP